MAVSMLDVALAGAVLAALWIYLEFAVWPGLRRHVRATWLRSGSIRRAVRFDKRRSAAFDREIRRFLEGRAGSHSVRD